MAALLAFPSEHRGASSRFLIRASGSLVGVRLGVTVRRGRCTAQGQVHAESSRVVKTRIGPILKVIRNAAPVDEDLSALWELIQTDFWANQRAIIESLAQKNALRPGLDVQQATDLLWTLNHPDVWLLLVDRRGWSPQDWESWFATTCREQLLASG